jgi:O-antigen biosynthesis protein
MKFLIYAPPYRNSSAGIRVLHRLSEELTKLGCNSFVFTDWSETERLKPYIGDCVVVYPEIIRGNPMGAKNVVRYVLNTPGYLGLCDATYADSELVFVYNKALLPAAQSATSQRIDESRLLEISVIEPWLFKPNPAVEKAYDIVFWVGKGISVAQASLDKINEYMRGKKCLQITYQLPSTREAMALLFQSSREFLTTDDFTAMLPEAKLCGCTATIMTANGPVTVEDDVSEHATKWYDTAAIQNFLSICRERFEACAAAA